MTYNFPSALNLEEEVVVELSSGSFINGVISGVSFTIGKVWYDIRTDLVLDIRHIDSALVHKKGELKIEKNN